MDNTGALIGVIVSKLNALSLAKATGDIPQNINFAIKAEVAQTFLRSHGVEPREAQSASRRATTDLAGAARSYTYLIACDPAKQATLTPAQRDAERRRVATQSEEEPRRPPAPPPLLNSPAPVPDQTPAAVPELQTKITGDGEWCVIWGRTADCRFTEPTCGGRLNCHRRGTF